MTCPRCHSLAIDAQGCCLSCGAPYWMLRRIDAIGRDVTDVPELQGDDDTHRLDAPENYTTTEKR